MELQTFINGNENYIEKFKELKINYRKNDKLGLLLIKTYRKNDYDYLKYPWIKYCRGVIIDIKQNKVINVPPSNALRIDLNDIKNSDDLQYENLIEGTMINMFYHNDDWIISTRSNIGCNNKWKGLKTFGDMFRELSDNLNHDNLNKNHCYTFVLQHIDNKIVIPVYENNIILVNEIELDEYLNVKLSDNLNVTSVNQFTYDHISSFNSQINYMIKGITIKDKNGNRFKYINPNYDYVSKLTVNNNKSLIRYVELRKNGRLKEYLQYFPEDQYKFNEYRTFYYHLVSLLYKRYVLFFIRKDIELNDVEYSLKPLIFEIHEFYKKTNNKITMKIIKEYINNMDSYRIYFIMKHL